MKFFKKGNKYVSDEKSDEKSDERKRKTSINDYTKEELLNMIKKENFHKDDGIFGPRVISRRCSSQSSSAIAEKYETNKEGDIECFETDSAYSYTDMLGGTGADSFCAVEDQNNDIEHHCSCDCKTSSKSKVSIFQFLTIFVKRNKSRCPNCNCSYNNHEKSNNKFCVYNTQIVNSHQIKVKKEVKKYKCCIL